jgi:hypothetical protein
MANRPTSYRVGEIRALLAPIFDMNAEDIDDFMIFVKAPCPDCGEIHGIQLVDSGVTFEQAMMFMSSVIATTVECFTGEAE